MDPTESEALRAALVRGCGLPAATTADALLEELARRVDYLLRHRTDKLMYYLYSLDVSESEVAKAFDSDTGDAPARTIARAILEREAQRIRTRMKYEQPDSGGAPRTAPGEMEGNRERDLPL